MANKDGDWNRPSIPDITHWLFDKNSRIIIKGTIIKNENGG
jgi:hypothetical protein